MPGSTRLLSFALMAGLLALAGSAQAGNPKIGDQAPNFELTLVSGQKVALSDLKGQVVVLNFWATWCVPCRTELPTLDSYYRIQKPHGLRVFAVTTENSLSEKKLHDLFSAMAIEPIHKLKGPYSYIDNGVPTNYVIDRAGKVRYAKAGAFNLDTLNAVLIPLLKEPAPAGAQVASAN
jgi:cytochrome c biogenesis protein CcmG, thiol:disulfide interchange protein DsbE